MLLNEILYVLANQCCHYKRHQLETRPCVCGAGAGTRSALRAGAGRVRVVRAAGAG